MKTVIIRSLVFAFFSALAMYCARVFLHTDLYLSDVGGIATFFAVFGILYGIMAAFVVFEVWNQYNTTVELVEKEANGLERLFSLTLYFRDKKLIETMRLAIKKYADIVIAERFKGLGLGQRNKEAGLAFRQISQVINEAKFDDDHDSIVFDHLLEHYGELSVTRSVRINQSLSRLPTLLKLFIYVASLFVLLLFILTPFSNQYYGYVSVVALGFVLAMVSQLIEDLDNPFEGVWNITPEPFERSLKHIEEDYS